MKDKAEASLAGVVALLFATPFIVALQAATYGFVFMKAWAWFVAPVFALPLLTFGQSAGLTFFVALVRSNSKADDSEPLEFIVKAIFYAIAMPPLLLASAWVVRLVFL